MQGRARSDRRRVKMYNENDIVICPYQAGRHEGKSIPTQA